jgi:hypothetical protein
MFKLDPSESDLNRSSRKTSRRASRNWNTLERVGIGEIAGRLSRKGKGNEIKII